MFTADGEADSLLAQWALESPSAIAAVYSEDSDMLTYGVPNMLFKLDRNTGECKHFKAEWLLKLPEFQGLDYPEVRCFSCQTTVVV